MAVIEDQTVVPESAVEYELLKRLVAPGAGLTVESDSTGARVALPASVQSALSFLVESLSRGERVTLVGSDQALTTQDAADMLSISRPTVIKYLDSGLLPYEMRGKHRRIALSDVLTFQRERQQRAEAVTNMALDADSYRPDVDHFVRTR